jgi:uncharacterized membrane protein YeaQ/YmgE (transglycosylase-associated protein family)
MEPRKCCSSTVDLSTGNYLNTGNIYRGNMHTESILVVLIIGALAGWLAGNLFKGKGFGLVGNIVVGIIGAVIGSFLFGLLGVVSGSFIGSLITATIGALVLLFIVNLIKKM